MSVFTDTLQACSFSIREEDDDEMKAMEASGTEFVIIKPEDVDDQLKLYRKLCVPGRLIYASKDQVARCAALGIGKEGWEATVRMRLLMNCSTWVGAELESIEYCIENGRFAKLTNVEVPEPFGLDSYDELKYEISKAYGKNEFEFIKCRTARKPGSVRNLPYKDVSEGPDGQEKLRSIEVPLSLRCGSGCLILIGGSPGSSWTKYRNLVDALRIAVIDPRNVDFDAWGHVAREANAGNIVEILNELRISRGELKRSIAHVDIRRDKPDNFKTPEGKEKWERMIVEDHATMMGLTKVLSAIGVRVIMKCRPLYNSETMIVPSNRFLIQPYLKSDSHEFRVDVPRRKMSEFVINVSEVIEKLDRINILRKNKFFDSVVRDRLRWLAVHKTRPSYFPDPSISVALLSGSNAVNDLECFLEACRNGMKASMPFRPLLMSQTSKCVTLQLPGRTYTDHAMNALRQFQVPFVYPMSDYTGILGMPSITPSSLMTVMVLPTVASGEQNVFNVTGKLVKWASSVLRTVLPDPTMPYSLRDKGAQDVAEKCGRVVKVCNDGKGGMMVSGRMVYASGHMLYYLLLEIMGVPVGIKRLMFEKRMNLFGIGSDEGAAKIEAWILEGHDRKDAEAGMWHGYYEDLGGLFTTKYVLQYMSVYMDEDGFSDAMKYIKMVEREIDQLASEVPKYRE